jgi:hypothetical protein
MQSGTHDQIPSQYAGIAIGYGSPEVMRGLLQPDITSDSWLDCCTDSFASRADELGAALTVLVGA